MEKLGINLGYLIAQIVFFLITLVLLKAWLYDPILNVLAQRRARIQQSLEDAREAEAARQNAERDAQKRLDEAQAEAQRIVGEASQRAEQAATGIRSKAEEESRRLLEQARGEAEFERNRALGDLRSQVVALSMAAAQRLVGAALDEPRQRQLVDDFFARVPETVRSNGAASAEVTSALPLTAEEQARAKRQLGLEDVTFKVDPRILGGVVVRVGDRVIDASAAGQLEEMRAALR